MIVEGPVAVGTKEYLILVQLLCFVVARLLETPFVNLINYASLVTTNAARHRFVAGNSKTLLEFGLRRAQGPDGGISASRYCYVGGFDATSNVAAGKLFNIPLHRTHSHDFVSSFTVGERTLCRHLFNESKRVYFCAAIYLYVVPQNVEELMTCYRARKSDLHNLDTQISEFCYCLKIKQEMNYHR